MCSLPLIIRYREETVSNIRCGVTASIARFQFQIRADRGSIPRNGTFFFALNFSLPSLFGSTPCSVRRGRLVGIDFFELLNGHTNELTLNSKPIPINTFHIYTPYL